VCLEYLRSGDTLVVWRLDRLGRSLRHLVDVIAARSDVSPAAAASAAAAPTLFLPRRHAVLLDGPSMRQRRTLVRFLGTVVCMEKLTFRFEDEEGAVILDGWAHRPGCPRLPVPLPARARLVPAGGVVLSEHCPHEFHTCAPRFLTLLSPQTASDSAPAGLTFPP
jgi:hypothetical protein